MTPRTPAPCHHELRPGTKVCLHCRRAEREATAARHRAIFTRIAVIAALIAGCGYAGVRGFDAWKERGAAGLTGLLASPASLEAAPIPTTLTGMSLAVPMVGPAPAPLVVDSTAPTAIADSTLAPVADSTAVPPVLAPAESIAPAPPPAPVVPAPVVVPPLQPIVAQGRTELRNGIYALRSGDTVTVHFDTPEARTRRPEKFEQIVRATLPDVHGAAADSILATIATGNLLGPNERVIDESTRPIALRGRDGQTLSLRPQTRPGRDGPLVIAYQVIPAR
jgi:hypothetical protein